MSRARAAALLALALAAAPGGAGAALERSSQRGPVVAHLRLEPEAPAIGDPLTLELEVRAEPGVELLMPSFGEALGRFAIVDFAPSERIDADGSTVARQRYTLQPSRSGPQSVPPLLVEFVDRRPGRPPAPEGEDAFELLTERLDFEVASALPEGAPLALRPAKAALPPLAAPGASRWPWLLAAALAAAAAAPFAVRAWLARRDRARRRSAWADARAELDWLLAGPRPRAAQMDAFYVKLSGTVRVYLERRFGLRAPELTTEEFLEAMAASPDLSTGHQQLLRDFLRTADLVKFAHHVPGPEGVEESLDAALRFLDETRPAEDAAAARARPSARGAEPERVSESGGAVR